MKDEGFVLRDVDYDDENARMNMLREIQCPYVNTVVSGAYDEYDCLINFQQNIYIEESKY